MLAEGALLLERAAKASAAARPGARHPHDAADGARATRRDPWPGAARRALDPTVDRAARRAPAARASSPSATRYPSASSATRAGSAPGTSSSRARRAPSSTTGRLLAVGHLPHRGEAAARGRGDGLRRRLPAADPPDRPHQPQGPEQHARRRPRRPGLAVGDRLGRGRARRHPPRPRHARGLRRASSRGRAGSASRSRSTSRCSARPTTRGSPSTRSGSPPSPTARSPTPRTRRRSTRTSIPLNFDNDPEGIYAEVLRIVRHWMSLGVRIFRVDNPHTKPLGFWEWLLHSQRDRPRRDLPRRGVHPAGR